MSNNVRTSEWVSPGHPDKVADGISEYILDRIIEKEPNVRYALEVQIKDLSVSIAGEMTTKDEIDPQDIRDWVKEAINKIGYTEEYQERFGCNNSICGRDMYTETCINAQSQDIAQGVNKDGWGDQGIFFGMWSGETEAGYTKDYYLAKKIGTMLYVAAKTYPDYGLGIDIKTQVTWDVDEEKVKQVIVAIPTEERLDIEKVRKDIRKMIVVNFPETKGAKFIINGTGAYHIHGPFGDSGTTGRKLVVDFYGSGCRIGGGSPWTKDGTKADLTLNLFARELAKLAYLHWKEEMPTIDKVETELSCCIGKTEVICTTTAYDKDGIPLHKVSDVQKVKPSFLIERYGLNRPIFFEMCTHGLFENFDSARVK